MQGGATGLFALLLILGGVDLQGQCHVCQDIVKINHHTVGSRTTPNTGITRVLWEMCAHILIMHSYGNACTNRATRWL